MENLNLRDKASTSGRILTTIPKGKTVTILSEKDENGWYKDRPFIAGLDDNFNVFNVDAFFTWDFRPGSRIIAGWKNWLGPDAVAANQYRNYYNNLKQTFDIPHGNELTLRVIYFLDYNQLTGKR